MVLRIHRVASSIPCIERVLAMENRGSGSRPWLEGLQCR
jgi:hypothetical protein